MLYIDFETLEARSLIMSTTSTTATESAQSPPFTFLTRVASIPLISSSLGAVDQTLSSSPYTRSLYPMAKGLSSAAYKYTEPLQIRLAPLISRADGYANKAVDVVESRYPYPFKAKPEEVQDYVRERRQSAAESINQSIDENVKSPALQVAAGIDHVCYPHFFRGQSNSNLLSDLPLSSTILRSLSTVSLVLMNLAHPPLISPINTNVLFRLLRLYMVTPMISSSNYKRIPPSCRCFAEFLLRSWTFATFILGNEPPRLRILYPRRLWSLITSHKAALTIYRITCLLNCRSSNNWAFRSLHPSKAQLPLQSSPIFLLTFKRPFPIFRKTFLILFISCLQQWLRKIFRFKRGQWGLHLKSARV